MDLCATLPFPQICHLGSKPVEERSLPSTLLFKSRSSSFNRIQTHCQKMYVPGFGEASPEKKAAYQLHKFFTYIAVRIISAQIQSYNREEYQDLTEFLSKNSLNDGDEFCAKLMRESPRHKSLALRILEVRSAYCKKDFEWDNLRRVASKLMDESNTRLMREYVVETTTATPVESEK
ncbi:hypothetical protein MLD38_019421 [Melastoma candidum]|uniref:Uncharacterized protein n=1 Tax=Melastoma candidum TaxID=119954 RepID=A0ACB9QX13_9MYRT|nr:hypothetical protein MLD38_019421 [Melastoma candidum]